MNKNEKPSEMLDIRGFIFLQSIPVGNNDVFLIKKEYAIIVVKYQ